MSRVNDRRSLVQHESCECKCRLNEIAFNSKQKWNLNECRCAYKELDDCGFCQNDYMRNPNTCDCECIKACEIDEYLDTKNCSCEKRLIGKIIL